MNNQLRKVSIERYSRQIVLKDIGTIGQKKIISAKVLIIGMGGLGSPVAEFLARAGVGLVGIVDDDKVSLSNLHRQSLYNINDIGEFKKERSSSKLAKSYGKFLHGTLGEIFNCPIPTVALIEGICVGGGLEIAACCDIRICGKSSRFGIPIKRLGLTMAAKELEVLLKVTNYSTAMEILFEGRVFSAEEAFEKKLVNRVVDDKNVEKEAYRSAELICEGAPKVARWHKQFARNILKNGKVTEKINNLGYKCYDTEDFKIGYKSFLNKTKPKFKNK